MAAHLESWTAAAASWSPSRSAALLAPGPAGSACSPRDRPGQERPRSFRWSFRRVLRDVTGPHQLDDAPDL